MRQHVLDASAIYRFLTNGPGAETVERVLTESRRAGVAVLVSAVNWAEALFALSRVMKLAEARSIMDRFAAQISVLPAGRGGAEEAAMLKMKTGLGLADAFAAVAASGGRVLVTSDADFDTVPGLRLLRLPGAGAS